MSFQQLFQQISDQGRRLFAATERAPALSTGLCVFLVLVYLYSIANPAILDKWSLTPWTLYNLELSRLTTYPLVHANFVHLLFNVVSLYGPLCQFEVQNGTVHTAIVLNFLATCVAIPYCLCGMLFFPTTSVLGASGWGFSMLSYYYYLQAQTAENTRIYTVDVPTTMIPFILLLVVGVLVPSSSFIGHLFAILAGYALGYGYLKHFTNPPFRIVERVESALAGVIGRLPPQIHYIREQDVSSDRYVLPSHGGQVLGTNRG
ncbi:putative membrane protein [Ogataea parapolymorpha DL-1]|uniref:Rhomboid-type serine protease 2 n=1 Tax=Ogataea parapolymorpha (strain ATCC 26012 / BCRC 20466 / JCM 22074 / NRRL Y-7560 / DL-1) TaxID=871575 RepID=W1Q9R0_OGAPD|nr:putative membrane protein [Ogataea parapolymorpha DL-1]ESW97556.1 putative membrane protein [Ogataea parapolymorpha DL-1]